MRWISITLEGFLPFTHTTGTKYLNIEFVDRVTCILAGNGVGKSSLLRALTPYPAVRTDFTKNGYIKKVIKHNSHVYEISSDFKNLSKPHSFIVDGTELNISGTYETQKDLVEEHFAITPLIDDLMSGRENICNMTKAERKQLFSATYPSDLTFVLDKHKKVCSQIRVFGNQIKLLAQREVTLKTNLMSEDQLQELNTFREQLNNVINRIDKINLLIENEISRIRTMPEYTYVPCKLLENPNDIISNTDYVNTLESLRSQYLRYRALYPNLFHGNKDINILINEASAVVSKNEEARKMFESNYDEIVEQTITTRDQLDEFNKCKQATNEDEKHKLEIFIADLTSKLKSLPNVARTIYTLPKENIDYIETAAYPRIYNLLSEIHPMSGSLITRKEIDNLENEIRTLTICINNTNADLINIKENLTFFENRVANLKKRSYPPFCVEVCALRDSVSKMIQETEAQRDIKLKAKQEAETRLNDYIKKVESLKTRVVIPSKAMPNIESLWNIMSENYLDKFALNGQSFIEALNLNCFEISNRILKLIEDSKVIHAIEEYKNDLQLAKEKLEIFKTAENTSMSLETINKMILSKENELNKYYDKMANIKEAIKKSYEHINLGSEVSSVLKNIEEMSIVAYKAINWHILVARVKFDETLLKEHTNVRNILNSKLREIETTINEQTSTRNILNNEVIPTLRQLERDKKTWESIEYGLSPVTGLPFVYLIRFINKLIERANGYIKEVWDYPMELVYLKEDETLDFSIEVLINQSSIVKDLSILSDGQKVIVNLAMMLAICSERKFTQVYPVKLDEVDAPLTDEHRTSLIKLLNRLVNDPKPERTEEVKQMFIINHFALQTGLANCGIVCLSTNGIEVPDKYNEHVTIY